MRACSAVCSYTFTAAVCLYLLCVDFCAVAVCMCTPNRQQLCIGAICVCSAACRQLCIKCWGFALPVGVRYHLVSPDIVICLWVLLATLRFPHAYKTARCFFVAAALSNFALLGWWALLIYVFSFIHVTCCFLYFFLFHSCNLLFYICFCSLPVCALRCCQLLLSSISAAEIIDHNSSVLAPVSVRQSALGCTHIR